MLNNESSNEDKTIELDDSVNDSFAGKRLQKQREELNMTVDEVASKLNLDVNYINAIETNDFSNISSTAYVCGYIRSYAKLLKLPEQEILDLYKSDDAEPTQLLPDYMGSKSSYAKVASSNAVRALLFVIIVGILFATWWFVRQ